jgi:hypothetical protein
MSTRRCSIVSAASDAGWEHAPARHFGRGPSDHHLCDPNDRCGLGVHDAHHFAVPQHGRAIRDRAHLLEPVRDEEHGHARPRELAHGGQEPLGLGLGQDGGWLIEDQDPELLLVHLARDLDKLHVPDRKPRDGEPLVDAETHAVQRATRVLAHAPYVQSLQATAKHPRQERPARRLPVQLDVLGDPETGEEHEFLMHHPDPGLDRLARRAETNRAAIEQISPV